MRAAHRQVAVRMQLGGINSQVKRIAYMDFKDAESLSKYIASANDMEGADRLSVLQQALGWLGDRLTSVLSDLAVSEDDSPNAIAGLENVLQFYADAWANGDIDLSKTDSGLPTSPAPAPTVAAQGAKRIKTTYAAKKAPLKVYRDLKRQAMMSGRIKL